MKALTQNEVKDNIFKILEMVKNGEDILIKGDHSKENFAVIMPFKKYQEKKCRQLGILKGKASYKLKDNFKITEEELLTI
jgi:hypothetical protein